MSELAEKLFSVGGHYTVARRYRHPSAERFLYGKKGSTAFFDITRTAAEFEKALEFITNCGKNGKKILFVGTRPEAGDLIEKVAEELSMPYVSGRWVGGTLSNFNEIRNCLNRMKNMEEARDSGVWERRYTKKEQLLLNREYGKVKERFGGIASLSQLPDAVFILDPKREMVALKEAQDTGIPSIGFTNGNTDLSRLSFAVIANSATRKSIEFVLNTVKEAYIKGSKSK